MNKREILKNEIQNWFYQKMSVLPSEALLNDIVDKIYYNKKLNLCDVGSMCCGVDEEIVKRRKILADLKYIIKREKM